MKRIKRRIVERWLTQVESGASSRIQNGDLDFDDVLYRSRDAARELLLLFFAGVK